MPTVDTLKAYEILTAAKVPEAQAKAIVDVVRGAQEPLSEHLVTKEYLESKMAALKTDIIKWMFGFFIGQIAVIAGLIKLLK